MIPQVSNSNGQKGPETREKGYLQELKEAISGFKKELALVLSLITASISPNAGDAIVAKHVTKGSQEIQKSGNVTNGADFLTKVKKELSGGIAHADAIDDIMSETRDNMDKKVAQSKTELAQSEASLQKAEASLQKSETELAQSKTELAQSKTRLDATKKVQEVLGLLITLLEGIEKEHRGATMEEKLQIRKLLIVLNNALVNASSMMKTVAEGVKIKAESIG